MADRYQSGLGLPGTFPTEGWWAVLREHIDGPLGTVLDVGCAEGVMSVLAARDGATEVYGIDTNEERIREGQRAVSDAGVGDRVFLNAIPSSVVEFPQRTVILSMIAHWIGQEETARLSRLATRNLTVIFREPNDHYAIPENGTWFPTLNELDETVGGIRTYEQHLLTQDNGKRILAATYRTDMSFVHEEGSLIWKRRPGFDGTGLRALREAGAPLYANPGTDGYTVRRTFGRDLHGDLPFRPTNGRPLANLDEDDRAKVMRLARSIARASLKSGWYPTDFAPRNVIIGAERAELVDLDEIERHEGTVDPRYLPIWQATLGACGVAFTGRLADLA